VRLIIQPRDFRTFGRPVRLPDFSPLPAARTLDTPPSFLNHFPMSESLSQRLADIFLPDAFGNQIRLGSLWESHPVVLVFLRHYG